MHQPLYPFAVNGPDCGCGHRRLKHVEKVPGTSQTVLDGRCQACPCDWYRATGETRAEYMERIAVEMAAVTEIHEERMAELRGRFRSDVGSRMVAFAFIIGALLAPESSRALLIGIGVGVMAHTSFASAWRLRGTDNRLWVCSHTGFGVALIFEAAAIVFGFPLRFVMLALGLTLAATSIGAWWKTHQTDREYDLVDEFIKQRSEQSGDD